MTQQQAAAPADFGALDDFMKELDSELGKKPSGKRAAPAKKLTWNEPANFEVEWHPAGISFRLTHQVCDSCQSEFQSVLGLFLIDETAFGAERSRRHEHKNALPPEYRAFQISTTVEPAEHLPCCPWCSSSSTLK